MANLLYKLHSLLRSGLDNKHEDYFTELFAEVLRDKDEALDFFKLFIGLNTDEISKLSVTTQNSYIKLPHHEVNSKPDMVIEFSCNEEKHVVFFENKIEHSGSYDQLRRYADHLQTYLGKGHNVNLIYLTKYYDPQKIIEEELINENISYIPLRWYQVYQWLQQRRNSYTDKVLNYMEELKMNHSRRFAPIDIIVMQHMKRLFSMMDECIGGQVEKTFTTLYGKQAQHTTRFKQLIEHNMYVLYINLKNMHVNYVAYGFSMYEDEYPNAYVSYELTPNYDDKANELARMKEFANKHEDWVTYGYDDGYPGIKLEKSIAVFLQEDDHVTAIQKFFIEKIKELNKLVPPISEILD